MKRLLFLCLVCNQLCFAQADEAKQLLLNVEKLAQFKGILQQMKDGYQLLHKGYTSVKDLTQGNFTLHKTFLDGLLQVSPAVRHYKKVADIIAYQLRIVKETKVAQRTFGQDQQFTVGEVDYIGKVYAHLLSESLKVLDELALVLTAGKLRMSDDERLQAIDRLYNDVLEQYTFLNEFNDGTSILSLQREKSKMELDIMRRIHGRP